MQPPLLPLLVLLLTMETKAFMRVNLKRESRRRLLDAGTKENEVPLGVGEGTHYAELYLGQPPQKASVIVDTGSHLTALPCSTCLDCGSHTDPPYDVSKSQTARFMRCSEFDACTACDNNQCRVSQSYAEGSMWSALLVDELCWIGPMDNTNASFNGESFGVRFPIGCQTKETGLFIGQKENGIMGLSQSRNSFMSYLYQARKVKHNAFSLCFAESGGQMILGGVDDTIHLSPAVYTPLVSTSGWFLVELLDIKLGNNSMGFSPSTYNSGRGVIVDSGTTDSFFPAQLASTFNSIFQELTGQLFLDGTESILNLDTILKLPSIFLTLRGNASDSMIILEIPPTQYYTKVSNEGHYTSSFHFSESSGTGVLGASTMLNYNVIFDMEARLVGFAPAQCDSSGRVLQYGPKVSTGPLKLPHISTFWTRHEAMLSLLLVISLSGLFLLCLTWFVRRRCKSSSTWLPLPTNNNNLSPNSRPIAPNMLEVSPDMVVDDGSPMTPPSPPSPQRRLSRSPDLHSIPESDSE
ncbi:aspartyl protease family A01B [Thraustotheca clavata]|uniref:Aspartyl protease family A01B n=1 Tax=Thraustotheca clavata TaxID=74557 RepID=A0A1W0A734_9STRA|nr:aspartyl protease family A01B [Thraustotheca clavata]